VFGHELSYSRGNGLNHDSQRGNGFAQSGSLAWRQALGARIRGVVLVDRFTGKRETVGTLPGFTRGLAIDLPSGQNVALLNFQTVVEEIFDVQSWPAPASRKSAFRRKRCNIPSSSRLTNSWQNQPAPFGPTHGYRLTKFGTSDYFAGVNA
jgi:hypothetical protein